MAHSLKQRTIPTTSTAISSDFSQFVSGDLQRDLNLLDPHKVWTWDPKQRRRYLGYPKKQLPMWLTYRVELFPHLINAPYSQLTGIKDEFGNDLEFPSAFRRSRSGKQRGIIQIQKGTADASH